ncbi:MAG: hypothetical protein ACKOA1_04860, partial [Bacteroidota bacterium]
RKLDELFSSMKEDWSPIVAAWTYPIDDVDCTRGKIFRGENYEGFPYTLLDFPRYFSKDAVFAVRTMCWWGNEFSTTLHLQGKALEFYRGDLTLRLERLFGKEIYMCVNHTPWKYGFYESNYRRLDELTAVAASQIIADSGFLKISRKTTLDDFFKLKSEGLETIRIFSEFLK